MATITVPLVLIEVAGPPLLALAVGAVLVALTWGPRPEQDDPIRTVAVIEVVLVGFGVAVWQGIAAHPALAGLALAVAVIGLVPAARLIGAAQQQRDSDEGWEYDSREDTDARDRAGDAPERTQTGDDAASVGWPMAPAQQPAHVLTAYRRFSQPRSTPH